MTRRATRQEQLAAVAAPPAAQGSTPLAATSVLDVPAAAGDVSNSTRATYIPPPTHFVGFGGRLGGSPLGEFGATARVWSRSRLGIQVEATRSSITSATAPGRVTSIQFAPSAIYSLRDYVTANVWMRPYVGGGAAFHRATFKPGTPAEIELEADTRTGFRAFGGAELTFPAVPRFAVSADIGHLWMETPYPGFDFGGMSVSVSGHWYVK
jgi:hypothetical protein